LERFRECFGGADALYLLQTFAARETPEAGIDAYALAAQLPRAPQKVFETIEDAARLLSRDLRAGDVCFTVGAGDVTHTGPLLLRELRAR